MQNGRVAAPRTARGHITRVLDEWSLPKFSDVASLIASELKEAPSEIPRAALGYEPGV